MEPPRRIVTIKQQVYEILRDDICRGFYQPGQQIQEQELSKHLSVSRSPIREALRQLASEGLVVESPNRGVFIREYTSKDIEDIYDLRTILESYAIMRLGSYLSPEAINELIACRDNFRRYHKQDDMEKYINEDTHLHQKLIELSGNSLVVSTYDRVYAMIYQYRSYSLKSKQRFDESLEEHTSIINNILSGDLEEADRINHHHLMLAKNVIIEHINEFSVQHS